jgi:hypothetical protein
VLTAFKHPVVLPLVLVLASWSVPARALDRQGAIEAAQKQVKGKCTAETPCKFTANAEGGKWTVRVDFTTLNPSQEKAVPGGHAIFIFNQAGKVVGQIEGK